MTRRRVTRAVLAAAGACALLPAVAGGHPADPFPDGTLNSGLEEHQTYGHGASGAVPGRKELPSGPKELGLKLIGKMTTVPEFGELGRVADVSAKGSFAYLTMYYEPSCGRGGVQIVDISNPANPVKRGYIPSHVDTFSGEGSQVVTMDTPSFKGDLLIYQNEWCPGTTNGVGGISLVDVTNPDRPKKLVEGAGDFTLRNAQGQGVPQTKANQTHSAFAWRSQANGRWYVVLVDDMEEEDVDILDITNPSKPVKVAEWNLDSTAQSGPTRPHGDAVFSHDMVVKRIGSRDVMLMSYWDGGYVQLDVTDPTVKAPRILADTDFAAVDPANSTGLTPEGNAHQAEFTRDNQFFFATDEDFDPFRVRATITGGLHSGTEFTAVQAGDAKPIDSETSVVGATRFLGLACQAGFPAADATTRIAVIERGVCDFQVKIDLAKAAGYTSVIVFNRTGVDGCETLINMLAVTDIPAIFVSRKDGFRILGQSLDGYTCDDTSAATGTPAPPPGPGQPVDISAIFDGWGYTHMYKAAPDRAGKLQEVAFYAPPENQDPRLGQGYGDLSVHEVATDPDANLVYVSHYALGMRVLQYTKTGLKEVGAFVERGGSNYWGVEVHKMGGKTYVLGSDRDRGLRVFQYQAGYVGDGE